MKKKVTILTALAVLIGGMFANPAIARAAEATPVQNAEVVSVEKLADGRTRTTYELEAVPEKIVDENGIETYLVDSSFIMRDSYYRGADRKYSGNYINYSIKVTAADGSEVDKQIAAQLWDYNGNCLSVSTVTANGVLNTVPGIKIVPNRTYYFKYYLMKGATSNLRIRMIVDTY